MTSKSNAYRLLHLENSLYFHSIAKTTMRQTVHTPSLSEKVLVVRIQLLRGISISTLRMASEANQQ